MMTLRNALPKEYDENYTLSVSEQTVIVEISILLDYFEHQIIMPMVSDGMGGINLTRCFQDMLAAMIKSFIHEGLMTKEFWETHSKIMDEKYGIKYNKQMKLVNVYNLMYDFRRIVFNYMVILGHNLELLPEKNDLYGRADYFRVEPVEEEE